MTNDQVEIPVIPARTTYYLGYSILNVRGRPAKVEVSIGGQSWVGHRYRLPATSKVAIARKPADRSFDVEVTGVLANTLRGPLDHLAGVDVVLFDKRGRVLGGTDAFASGDIPPGRRAVFHGDGFFGVDATQVAYARVSANNQLTNGYPG